jgi:hypothetical protein
LGEVVIDGSQQLLELEIDGKLVDAGAGTHFGAVLGWCCAIRFVFWGQPNTLSEPLQKLRKRHQCCRGTVNSRLMPGSLLFS